MWSRILAGVFVAACMACGGDGPTDPSSDPGAGAGGSNLPNVGTINAVIDGTAWNGFASSASIIGGFVGINGYTFPLPTPSNLNFRFASSAGTHTVGSGNAPFVQYNLTTMPAPVWQAGSGSGSGAVTVTTLTATGTSGSFSIIVGPICCGASGNKTITGTFNVRF